MDINMNFLSNVLKSFTEQTHNLEGQINALHKFLWFLLIVLLTNIVVTIIKYYLDRQHARQAALLQRRKLIFEQSINIEKEIFKKVDSLSDYTREECPQLIQSVNSIRDELNESRLFFDDKVYESIDGILNYFTEIAGDFRKKNLRKEIKLKKKYIEAFHG